MAGLHRDKRTGIYTVQFYNAMCESFFATLECELIDRRRFAPIQRDAVGMSLVSPPRVIPSPPARGGGVEGSTPVETSRSGQIPRRLGMTSGWDQFKRVALYRKLLGRT